MFSLVLATILTGVQVALGDPQMGSATTGSFGIGATGGLSFGGSYGGSYGSRYGYGYSPMSSYTNGYGGFSNGYIPGMSNTFVPFVRESVSSIDSPLNERIKYENPQTYVFQGDQRYMNPSYLPEIQTPLVKSFPYYSVPFFEVVETYKFYKPTKAFMRRKKGMTSLDSNVKVDSDNKTANTSEATEPALQLTYLGYVPHSMFRTVGQSGLQDDPRQRIPFYILDYSDDSSSSPRSSLDSPTAYVSPTRFLPSSGASLAGSSHGLPARTFSSYTPTSTGSIASPYRTYPLYRSADSDEHSGYYLFDVEPKASDTLLGAPQPTFPMIQTLTGPMGGPISGMLRPTNSALNTNTQAQSGFYKGGANVNKVENQNFKTGYETQLPFGHAYSDFQSNKQESVQKFDGMGQQGFNNGYGSQSFGSPGLGR